MAASLTVSWDAPSTNVDGTALTDLGGYKIYWGGLSRDYANVADVGLVTTTTVVELPTGQAAYFAVTAYNAESNESAYSDELVWVIPAKPGLTTVKTTAYNAKSGKATIVFNVAQLTETGGSLTNAAALWVRTVNSAGSVTNSLEITLTPRPASTATASIIIPVNSGVWSTCAAVSNTYGQLAPYGLAGYFGTGLPGKPRGLRIVNQGF
jgi:hypothetical protein